MTISTTAARSIGLGNSASTTWTYSFLIPGSSTTDQTNLDVIYTDTAGVETNVADNLWVLTPLLEEP